MASLLASVFDSVRAAEARAFALLAGNTAANPLVTDVRAFRHSRRLNRTRFSYPPPTFLHPMAHISKSRGGARGAPIGSLELGPTGPMLHPDEYILYLGQKLP